MTEQDKIKSQDKETAREFIKAGVKALLYCRENKIELQPEHLTALIKIGFKAGFTTREKQAVDLIEFYSNNLLTDIPKESIN